MRLPSGGLVGLQFGLLAAVVLGTAPQALSQSRGWIVALPLFALGLVLGMWALGYNKIGNFNIRPEVRADADLITGGPYRRIRHPMYTALLLVAAGLIAIDPRLWRAVLWLALFAVLNAKAAREEALLLRHFAGYGDYMRRTARFIPGLY